MPRSVRHTFKTRDVIQRQAEQRRFYIEIRGRERHSVGIAVPMTKVSDCRQVAEQWHKTFKANLARMYFRSKSWKSVAKLWTNAHERLKATQQDANETYDDNAGFWLAVYKVASEVSSLAYTLDPLDVLVWAFTDTVENHATVVYNAGRSAVGAASDVAGAMSDVAKAIPTVAKAAAVGAIGLGVYAIAKR